MTAQPDLKGIQDELARRSLLNFTLRTFPKYQVNWHHRLVAHYLDEFVNGKIMRLIIEMPPQTGKSELSSRRLPCFMLGKNPDLNIAIASYNIDRARSFNRQCQRIIEDKPYQDIFPKTKLNDRRVVNDSSGTYLKNTNEFEIVGYKGKLKVAGIGTMLTGDTVDILICDDLVKDMVEAKSPVIQLRNINWWDSVAMNRLHNYSQILLLMTRWDQGDVIGRLQSRMRHGECEPFVIISLPSIKENNNNKEDPRIIGQALWPEMHSLKKLKMQKKANPATFQALHQQDPSVSTEFRIWAEKNEETGEIKTWKKINKMPGHDKFYGLDWGFTNSPTACVECQHHKGKGYVKELFYELGMENEDIAKRLKLLGVKRHRVVCDGAEPKSIVRLRRLGINAVAGLHCANSINTQIIFLQKLDMHYVVAKKNNLEFELDNHQWMPGPDGPVNQEVDKNNHLTKAIMYAFYMHLNRPKAGIEII